MRYPNLKKPWRVDNTCKAELDDVALLVSAGSRRQAGLSSGILCPKEKRKSLAGERALNVKAYISGGEAKQNIDLSRIEAHGKRRTATSEQWIVPAGATFPGASSTTPVG